MKSVLGVLIIILFYLIGFVIGKGISYLINNRKQISERINNSTIIQSNGNLHLKENEKIKYWYEKPHWHILSNGQKINLAEYFTYDEWNNLSEVKKAQKLLIIESKLYSNNEEKVK